MHGTEGPDAPKISAWKPVVGKKEEYKSTITFQGRKVDVVARNVKDQKRATQLINVLIKKDFLLSSMQKETSDTAFAFTQRRRFFGLFKKTEVTDRPSPAAISAKKADKKSEEIILSEQENVSPMMRRRLEVFEKDFKKKSPQGGGPTTVPKQGPKASSANEAKPAVPERPQNTNRRQPEINKALRRNAAKKANPPAPPPLPPREKERGNRLQEKKPGEPKQSPISPYAQKRLDEGKTKVPSLEKPPSLQLPPGVKPSVKAPPRTLSPGPSRAKEKPAVSSAPMSEPEGLDENQKNIFNDLTSEAQELYAQLKDRNAFDVFYEDIQKLKYRKDEMQKLLFLDLKKRVGKNLSSEELRTLGNVLQQLNRLSV